eukprot:CAMPEP_0116861108 /NCGR_PEP_ID=MMETSP0418-20121206/22837_1 /TAXON_ID=1158023 /ORGANISM="Astrosyne radiata, Strain 13vi08-1A" /LENGTH=205 /DNA_ID=CAMNT_0004495689 /DNA_START=31 /DNA_END=648 /DNA_ORIENTATION=+
MNIRSLFQRLPRKSRRKNSLKLRKASRRRSKLQRRQSRTTVQKSVTFSDEILQHEAINRRDMTKMEIRNAFYTPDELRRIQNEIEDLVMSVYGEDEDESDDFDLFPSKPIEDTELRGLERFTPAGSQKFEERWEESLFVVLEEQERQKKQQRRRQSRKQPQKKLSLVSLILSEDYQKITNASQTEALQRGYADQEAILKEYVQAQ